MIIGIDEVGRGCWAGPVTAAAVLLPRPIDGLRDSKTLNASQRQALDKRIRASTAGVGIGWATAREIDCYGLTQAVRLAMERALSLIAKGDHPIIIDGSYNFLAHLPLTETHVRADAMYPAVSAASIVAKVARDAYMADMRRLFPGYAFHKHVGYGTAQHRQELLQNGASWLHRMSVKPIAARCLSSGILS